MPKLIRVTTVDLSLHVLLEGQLGFLNREFELVGVAADTGLLKAVGEREGIRVIDVPMHREIALWSDIKCLCRLVRIFRKEKPFHSFSTLFITRLQKRIKYYKESLNFGGFGILIPDKKIKFKLLLKFW